MKLSEKGKFAPPPTLTDAAQCVAVTLGSWDEVHARAHWLLGDENVVDGADFYVGQDEVGHIHLNAEAHVALPIALVEALVASGLARRFRWSRAFVVFAIEEAADVEHARWLFRLSYDHRRGASRATLLERIKTRGAPDSSGKRDSADYP